MSEWIDEAMEQAQVFASTWSLVDTRWDNGTCYEQSQADKAELRKMLELRGEEGAVVVTTNEAGQCVAVTRQNDEGQILKVIWQAK